MNSKKSTPVAAALAKKKTMVAPKGSTKGSGATKNENAARKSVGAAKAKKGSAPKKKAPVKVAKARATNILDHMSEMMDMLSNESAGDAMSEPDMRNMPMGDFGGLPAANNDAGN